MKKFNEEKIIKVLQEAEGDITVREVNVGQAEYYRSTQRPIGSGRCSGNLVLNGAK